MYKTTTYSLYICTSEDIADGCISFSPPVSEIAQNGDLGRLNVQYYTAPGAQASTTTRSRSKPATYKAFQCQP